VINDLLNLDLLRNVRDEILENLHFTPKETDIYKIHQSGDLANLDGLDDSSLARLPSLLTLRDALYSSTFRKYISSIADAGPLSGKKTDMAINVYTPGCHLLCHDDVIGSRKLSYILYLTDPEHPWKPEWGGALRLYPTTRMKTEDGTETIVPSAEFSKSIPPAFNQLSFFTIQPGKSFHDVEEVYNRQDGDDENDGGRMRMAISGWFHIPQEGEEGYEEGAEQKQAERSSLSQLQGKADELDLPLRQWKSLEISTGTNNEDLEFTDAEFDWLLRFINPTYLTPDTLEQLSEGFQNDSVITLVHFLHPKFAEKVRQLIANLDVEANSMIPSLKDNKNNIGIARPPHKHRFVYRHPCTASPPESGSDSPLDQLVEHLFPSGLFARWLRYVTGLTLSQVDILLRRFRKGSDYTLATSYDQTEPQLEICLGLTPTSGWGDDDEGSENTAEGEAVGGYEVYMAGDDDDDDDDEGSDDEVKGPVEGPSNTGAGQRRKTQSDPAVYKSSGDDDEDGILFSMSANWNNLSIVLRDAGVLRFVKYVSKSAKGDRWDLVGNFTVVPDEDVEE
jgi:Rps23 Pro-64 3,4-dihydroxylase Tpa1-like proline 4-hydroxylase